VLQQLTLSELLLAALEQRACMCMYYLLLQQLFSRGCPSSTAYLLGAILSSAAIDQMTWHDLKPVLHILPLCMLKAHLPAVLAV
jgi:hypothetical protein